MVDRFGAMDDAAGSGMKISSIVQRFGSD